jgi:SPP1 family predicted phage head-tail adaptor
MRAGLLRHRVQFDEAVTTQDDTGGEVVTWTYRFTEWARIEPRSGREQLRANQILADADTKIVLRWSPTTDQINATWRCRHGNLIYNIMAPPSHIEFGRRTIELLVKSGLNNG